MLLFLVKFPEWSQCVRNVYSTKLDKNAVHCPGRNYWEEFISKESWKWKSQFRFCITASGSKSHQLLAAWRKGGNHQTSHKMRARPHYYGCSLKDEGAPPSLWVLSQGWGRAPIILGALHNQQALIHLSKPPPLLPACNISWSPLPPHT
jgi:hypothetical protein